MLEDGALGMEIRGLLTVHSGCNLGQNLFEQAALVQQFQTSGRMGRGKEFDQFISNQIGWKSGDCSQFTVAAISGKTCLSKPLWCSSSRPRAAWGGAKSLINSSRIRSDGNQGTAHSSQWLQSRAKLV